MTYLSTLPGFGDGVMGVAAEALHHVLACGVVAPIGVVERELAGSAELELIVVAVTGVERGVTQVGVVCDECPLAGAVCEKSGLDRQ